MNNALPNRIPKSHVSLYANSTLPNHGIVHRWKFGNGQVEAREIARSCLALVDAGVEPSGILILLVTRNPSVMLWPPLQEELARVQLPFEPPKEAGFIDSKPGRLVLALTRIVCSRDQAGITQDLIAHRTLLGLKSGVGVSTCDNIRQAVLSTPNLSFRDLFYTSTSFDSLTSRAKSALSHARGVCGQISVWTSTDTLAQRSEEIANILTETIIADSGDDWRRYADTLIQEITLEELRDYLWADTDQQRANVVVKIHERLGRPLPPNAGFPPKIRVMTMHGAKGLSAKVVFIPGLEQGILPNRYQEPYPSQILEAARLLYVSITRARASCILSYAMHRTVRGSHQSQNPSQFTAQTGGAFSWRQNGLTASEVSAIMTSVNLL